MAERIFFRAVTALACALFVATIPGAARRAVARDAPAPVEIAARGDGVIEVHTALAGVRVRAYAVIDTYAHLVAEARTDASGALQLEHLPRGEHWIVADAPGRARASSHLIIVGNEHRSIRLELAPEHAFTLDVRDEENRPIAGAEVEVAGGDPLPVGARTDAGGHVRVGRLDRPPWLVTVRKAGFEDTVERDVASDAAHLVVTLPRLGAILVRVEDAEGHAAPRARVYIAGSLLWPARVADADAEGRVRIGALAAGAYALRAVSGAHASPIELGVELARGEKKDVVLRLGAARTVDVRVTDGDAPDAPPIAGARVTLAEAGLSPFPIEAATDRFGKASLGPIAVGSASLSVRADGFVTQSAVAVPDRSDVTIALVRAGTLVGSVTDTRGRPVDGASLEVVGTDFLGGPIDDDPRANQFRDAHFDAALAGPKPLLAAGELGVLPGPVPPIPRAGSPELTALTSIANVTPAPEDPWVTRGDGSFRLNPVTPGRVRVLVRHPQYVEEMSESVTLAPGGEANIRVVMKAGGTLEGRVVDAEGRPVAGARVSVSATRGSMERATQTASDGTFAFASIPEGVVLTVANPGAPLDIVARVVVSVAEGKTADVTIALSAPREPLDVRVVDDRDDPLDAVQLSVSSVDANVPLRTTVFTDAHGDAEIPSAKGLSIRIEARAPGYATEIVHVDSGAERAAIALVPSETATGLVRERYGRPIAEAQIVAYTAGGVRRAHTAADGTFALTDLTAGRIELRVFAPGYATYDDEEQIEATGGRRAFEIRPIELAEEGIVEGTVVDDQGEPVPGARVASGHAPVYLAVGTTPPGVAVADARGHFRLGGLAEGLVDLEAYAPDVGRTRFDAISVDADRVTDVGRLTLQRSGEPNVAPDAAGGVAVTLGETGGDDAEIVIVAVAPGSEAERAGIIPGDALVDVDGVHVTTMHDARAKLSGPLADDVVVTLRRGDRTDSIRLAREQVHR